MHISFKSGLWTTLAILLFILTFLNNCSSKKNPSNPGNGDTIPVDTIDTISWEGNPPVLLNELAPTNIDLRDKYGNDPDWVEIYNPADTAVNLKGYALSEHLDRPHQWVFPSLIIPPKSYEIVFLSGVNDTVTAPPGNTFDLLGTHYEAWADGERGDGGNSEIHPWEFEDFQQLTDSGYIYSVAATIGDESMKNLGWSTSKITIICDSLNSSDVLDISGSDYIHVRATIEKSKRMMFRVIQKDVDEWDGFSVILTGTGIENDLYKIPLPQNQPLPDLSAIQGFRIEAHQNDIGTIHFTIYSILAVSSPKHAHAPFKLSKSGGSVYLFDAEGDLRDSVQYPATPTAKTWALDSALQWGYQEPSPLQANGYAGVSIQMPQSIPDLPSGFYAEPITISLPSPEGASIHYTLDGSWPNSNSPLYQQPLTIAQSCVLRTITIKNGSLTSEVTNRSYFIGDSVSLPVISIAVDPGDFLDPDTGLYSDGPEPLTEMPYYNANYWRDIELPIHVEFFNEAGSRKFGLNAGLEIFGNYSRTNSKKSLALRFRERYGSSSLDYPIFPNYPVVDQFKALVLRAGGNYTPLEYLRDVTSAKAALELNVDVGKMRPSVIYVNGQYWGFYWIREKLNAEYITSNYGYDETTVDLVRPWGNAQSGSAARWNEFKDSLKYIAALMPYNAIDSVEAFKYLTSKLDWNEYLNYQCLEIFVSNTDWPGNNWKVWSDRNTESPWRHIAYDFDFAFGGEGGGEGTMDPDFNTLAFAAADDTDPDAWPNGTDFTRVFRHLLSINRFRVAFIHRMSLLLNTTFSTPHMMGIYSSFRDVIALHKERDIARWEWDAEDRNRTEEKIENYIKERPGYMWTILQSYFDLQNPVEATISRSDGGSVLIHGQKMSESIIQGKWFIDAPITLEAIPFSGHTFVGWSDGVQTATRPWSPQNGSLLRAEFR